MLDRVGKAAFRAARTEDIAAVMHQAVRLARSGRPGAGSVEIPIDQQYRSVVAQVPAFEEPTPVQPEPDALDHAAALLTQARRPLIWAGGGVISAGAAEALRVLAERIGAGVLTSAAG